MDGKFWPSRVSGMVLEGRGGGGASLALLLPFLRFHSDWDLPGPDRQLL